MESDLTQVSELLQLLEERDTVVEQITAHILDKIQSPLLEVLTELFGLPEQNIEWLDVQYMEKVLLIMCAIQYDPKYATAYLRGLFKQPSAIDVVDENMKMIRIGIPISYVFGSRENIIKFLYEVANDSILEKIETTVENSEKISDNVLSFDISRLTKEQIRQMELFDKQGKGAKH